MPMKVKNRMPAASMQLSAPPAVQASFWVVCKCAAAVCLLCNRHCAGAAHERLPLKKGCRLAGLA